MLRGGNICHVNDLEIESKDENSEDHMYVPPSDRSTIQKLRLWCDAMCIMIVLLKMASQ